MRFGVPLLVSVILAGCATTSVSEFATPDGTKARAVKCTSDPQKCYVAASASCPQGTYRVVSSESHSGGIAADILPGPVTWYGMLYVCGASDGKMPDFALRGPQPQMPQMPQAPVVIQSAPASTLRTTNCSTVGGSVNCTSY